MRLRLRLRPQRRGISWSEAAVLIVVIVVALSSIEVVFDDPAAWILSAVAIAGLLVGLRVMANRDPA